MLSLPMYVAAPGAISSEIERLLYGASFVLILPALLFSAQPTLSRGVESASNVAHGCYRPRAADGDGY